MIICVDYTNALLSRYFSKYVFIDTLITDYINLDISKSLFNDTYNICGKCGR